jgi:hypothetical protein
MSHAMNRAIVGIVLLHAMAAGAEPTFTEPPSAAAEGAGVRIRFAVAAPCDAEVTVLDGKGAEVRHLAAGLLGAAEAAPPLTPRALDQSILWDRTDDRGDPVVGTDFSVRVRLGLRVTGAKTVLKGVIDDKPWRIKTVLTDPDPAEPGEGGLDPAAADTQEGKDAFTGQLYDWQIYVDKQDDRIYASFLAYPASIGSVYRYRGSTGKAECIDEQIRKIRQPGEKFAIGLNGDILFTPYRRFTRDFEPVPLPEGVNTHPAALRFDVSLWAYQRSRPFHEQWGSGNDAFEGLDGRYYIHCARTIPFLRLFIWDTLDRKRALTEGYQSWLDTDELAHVACIRADTKGKLYLARAGGPKDAPMPEQRYPKSWKHGYGYGSILRIDPHERWVTEIRLPIGAVPEDPEERKRGFLWGPDYRYFIPRIEKCYAGVMSYLVSGCCCKSPLFDLDEHGRLYVPDADRESLVILDNAGNEVLRLEKQVAAETAGGGRINLAWPRRVVCSRKAVYYTDGINKRIVRLGLGHAVETMCRLPQAAGRAR